MKPVIVYDDFAKLDIRVGVVTAAYIPDWSTKLLGMEIDFGEEIGTRTIFSGIQSWYAPDDVLGKKFPCIVNLAPKKMGQHESAGMMIMADGAEKPILLPLDQSIAPGTSVR